MSDGWGDQSELTDELLRRGEELQASSRELLERMEQALQRTDPGGRDGTYGEQG